MIITKDSARFSPYVPPTNALLIPIWGQSNANGFYQQTVWSPFSSAMSNVKIWNYTLGTPAFQSLQVGVNNDIDTGAQLQYPYFGMELSLGYYLANYFQTTVYLMKYAQQNTTMYDNWNASTGSLYSTLISRILAAKQALVDMGKTVTIPCMLSYQGESDGFTSTKANAYLSLREAFYTAVKNDLGLSSLIDVFVRIQISLPQSFPYAKTVYNAQNTFQSNDPTNRKLISSDNLSTSDGVHINAQGQISLGQSAFNIIKTYYS